MGEDGRWEIRLIIEPNSRSFREIAYRGGENAQLNRQTEK